MRVLVVDDEPAARRKVVRFLQEHRDVEVAGEAGGGIEAIERIAHDPPDVVFLDIQMPDMNGFEVVEALAASEQVPAIIFATAHDEYAVRAFEVSAVDYLLKPFDRERFDRALERARKTVADGEAAQSQLLALLDHLRPQNQYARRLLVPSRGRALFVNTSDILHLEAERNNVSVHSRDGTFVMRSTLDALERKLDPQQFVRIHRSHVVNIDAIREIHPWFHGDFKVRLHDGSELMWSRRFAVKRPDLLP
ncbi:MAG TPA: LytTR family DNA-binding domain-containing protein [Candidatus Baltobacteraceae bacterium]|nr:LytTR family DNA-binding domain-containing protein [Candidatus Baltobacteraceae bacterium]